MSYISHEDYKNLMSRFQADSPKGVLKEAVEEGNAFTAALAKTKKGEKAKVGDKEITDTSDYDDPSVKEYGYADNYPGSRGYKEGKEVGDDSELVDLITRYTKDDPEKLAGMDPQAWPDHVLANLERDKDYQAYKQKHQKEDVTDSSTDVKELFDTPLPGADKDRFQKVASVKKLGTGRKDSPYQAYVDDRDPNYAVRVAKDMIDKGIEDNYILYHLTTVDGLNTTDARIAINKAFDDNNYETQPYHVKYEEGLNPAPLQATGPTISTVEEDHMKPFKLPKRTDTSRLDYDPDASRFEPDYMKAPGEEDDDFDDDIISDTDDEFDLGDDIPAQFKRAVAGDRKRHPFLRENSTSAAPFGMEALPPGTKKQLQTSGLKRLSPDETKQLQEYIESVKTIQKEIAKLAAKAGKKIKVEGGDTTGLMMNPSVTSEAASKDEIESIEDKITDKLYTAAEKVIEHLMKADLSPSQIKKFLNHEVEEMSKKKVK